MCDPFTMAAVGTAASVGGNYLNSQNALGNQKNAIWASNNANTALQAKENELQKQSSGIFDQTLKPFQGELPGQNLSAAQGGNTAAISGNAPTAAALAGGATTGNAPQVVADSENKSIADRMKTIGDNGARLGALSGYDALNQDTGRNLRDSSNQLGVIGNFAQQDANVGAATRQAAITNSQKAPSPFGDLLAGGGQVLSAGAGRGWFNKSPLPTPTYGALY